MSNNENTFEQEHRKFSIRLGRTTNLLGVVLAFLPAIVLTVMGYPPILTVTVTALVARVPQLVCWWIIEPISYYNSLGLDGTYMSFLSGNIFNMRVPCSVAAQEAAGVKQGTNEGNVISTIGVAVSIVVNVVILTIAVIFGSSLLANVSKETIQTINFMLPALFGALLANEIVKRPKLAKYIAPVFVVISLAYKLGWLNFMTKISWYKYVGGNYAVCLIVIVFSCMFLGKYLAGKGKV